MMMLGNCLLQKLMMFNEPDAVTDDVYLKNQFLVALFIFSATIF
jgi:hypothetical protein